MGTIVPDLGNLSGTGRLASALFTTTQQRVLALLFGHADRSFFTKEIIREVGGAGAAQRELARLENSGIILSSRVGNQKHYRANPTSPIFDELRSIVMKTIAVVDPLREALRPLTSHIELALIYGSVAKGEENSTSDIDVLVVGSDLTLEQLFRRFNRAEKMIGRKVNPTLYTPDEFRRRIEKKNPFVDNVLRGRTLPLIGDLNDFAATR